MGISVELGSEESAYRRDGNETMSLLDHQRIKSGLSLMLSKLGENVTLDTIRPLPMFLGITGPSLCFAAEAFNPPSTKIFDKTAPEKVLGRLSLNFAFFVSNYAFIAINVSVVVTLMHLDMVMYLGLLCAFWWFHNFTIKNQIPLTIGGKDLNNYMSVSLRSTLLSILTLMIVSLFCLLPAIEMICISSLLIFSHALLRDPKHIESSFIFRKGSQGTDEDDDESSGEEVMVERGDAV